MWSVPLNSHSAKKGYYPIFKCLLFEYSYFSGNMTFSQGWMGAPDLGALELCFRLLVFYDYKFPRHNLGLAIFWGELKTTKSRINGTG